MGRIVENFKRKAVFERVAYFVSIALTIAVIVLDIICFTNELPEIVSKIATLLAMLALMGLAIFSFRDLKKQCLPLLIVEIAAIGVGLIVFIITMFL